jgi:hypothetical protein
MSCYRAGHRCGEKDCVCQCHDCYKGSESDEEEEVDDVVKKSFKKKSKKSRY